MPGAFRDSGDRIEELQAEADPLKVREDYEPMDSPQILHHPLRLWDDRAEGDLIPRRGEQPEAFRLRDDRSIQIVIPPKFRPLAEAALPDRELDAGARPDAKGRISSVEKVQSGCRNSATSW